MGAETRGSDDEKVTSNATATNLHTSVGSCILASYMPVALPGLLGLRNSIAPPKVELTSTSRGDAKIYTMISLCSTVRPECMYSLASANQVV